MRPCLRWGSTAQYACLRAQDECTAHQLHAGVVDDHFFVLNVRVPATQSSCCTHADATVSRANMVVEPGAHSTVPSTAADDGVRSRINGRPPVKIPIFSCLQVARCLGILPQRSVSGTREVTYCSETSRQQRMNRPSAIFMMLALCTAVTLFLPLSCAYLNAYSATRLLATRVITCEH